MVAHDLTNDISYDAKAKKVKKKMLFWGVKIAQILRKNARNGKILEISIRILVDIYWYENLHSGS